ncbi:uncharacterized protein LOC113768519 isoform X3 [Coffea eugenioides]|uniref:uncharacterized protein LOC113768519 isoform X3 n=1 Tax=Coffea eugenioides TaxID=49369 RepID=UPI000F60A15C|nr:uncharacterized protein LOC113768519 isoform X3 [Coffea eugenioides]
MVNQKFNSIRNLQEQRFEEMNQRILAIGQRIDKHEVVVEKLLVSSRSNLEKTIQETKQRCMKLKFNSNISVPIRTGEQIKGEGGSNLQLSLIDNCTGAVVDFGREASAKVEIVALKEGLDDDEGDAWTAEQFQSKIARDREGKQYVLAGNLQPKLNKGTVSLSDVMFRSSQRHNGGIFKLGAWVVDTFDGSQVIEAKTKSFKVLDYRGKYTQKHYPPSASDEVWRLENIAKNGATHERLKGANVNYVKDFQTRLSEDPEELKCLVGLRPTQWEATVRHAQTCKPDNMVGQVPAPAPVCGDACNMLVASAHEDKGIPFDGNIMPALESITLRRKQKLIEPAFEPMIRKIVKEEVDLAMKKYLISIRRTCGKEICPSESGSLQLQFLSGISLPVFTGTRIEGRDFNNLQVALVDPFTGQVVSIGPQSAAKVEIVVLEGDFDGDESDNWTFEEFKNNIVREREGKKPLLTGDAFLTLEQGIGVVSDISITDNSSWTRSRKFRLGARVVDNSDGNRVKEAKTDSFIVRDHRGELYKKHHPPSLADEVWRLEKIGKDGAFHRCLRKERIKTVKDFLTLYFVDPARLRNILGTGMSTKMWEVTVDHARTCVLDKELYFYYPSRSQHKKGVVFSVVGEVMGFVSDCQYNTHCQYITHDKLSETEKAYARDLMATAYRDWTDVVSIDDEASLMDGSLFLSTIEYSSNPPMLDGSKVLNSHKSGKCDYPEPNTCSDIMPSMDSLRVLSPLDVHDFPIVDSLENIFGHPLNISGQVTNNMICDIDSMTPAFYEDKHGFDNSAESETTRPSHNRNSPYRFDTDTRNADYTISDLNRFESVDIVRVRTVEKDIGQILGFDSDIVRFPMLSCFPFQPQRQDLGEREDKGRNISSTSGCLLQ